MLPHAGIRVALLVAFLLWVFLQFGDGLLHLLEPPKRVRPPDTAVIPEHQLNPRPQMGTLPPAPPMSEAQARETLREHGYFEIRELARQPDGTWTATATRWVGDKRIPVRLARNGEVASP
jgi:hypothetical protein